MESKIKSLELFRVSSEKIVKTKFHPPNRRQCPKVFVCLSLCLSLSLSFLCQSVCLSLSLSLSWQWAEAFRPLSQRSEFWKQTKSSNFFWLVLVSVSSFSSTRFDRWEPPFSSKLPAIVLRRLSVCPIRPVLSVSRPSASSFPPWKKTLEIINHIVFLIGRETSLVRVKISNLILLLSK